MPWEPQPGPQTSFLLADWCPEIFFGGERGGGKSDAQLGYQEDAALRFDGKSRGIMFRKTYTDLEELQARAREIFTASGAVYKTQPSAGYPHSNCWYWPSGASVKMRYMEHERDYQHYHGHQYSHVSADELTDNASPTGYLLMMSTLRNAHGVPCSIRATGNPGGIGHSWVKARFVDVAPPLTPYVDPDAELMRMFIPSRLSDNRILLSSDEKYRGRLLAATAGNEALRKAWLEGDWDIVAGAFFSEFRRDRHVIKPFTIPRYWVRFRAMDWGSASPFCVLWFAVSDGEHPKIPRGALVVYREWYGARQEKSGEWAGLKMPAEDIGRGIKDREQGENIAYGVLDPSAFANSGGPSYAERMGNGGAAFHEADNQRSRKVGAMSGWDMVRHRLQWKDVETDEEFPPMIYFFDTCQHIIRTLPLVPHDPNNIEDIYTHCEDHAVDTLRYGCLSRPWIRDHKTRDPFEEMKKTPTFNQVVEMARRRRLANQ